MANQTKTIERLRPLLKEEGVVIIGRKKYDQLLKRLLRQKEEIKKIKEEAGVDQIIAQGEKELKEDKTIVAQSSKEALKIFYGRKNK